MFKVIEAPTADKLEKLLNSYTVPVDKEISSMVLTTKPNGSIVAVITLGDAA